MNTHRYITFFQILVYLLCMNNIGVAQSVDEIVKKFNKRSYSYQNTTLPYRIFIPENYDSSQSYPLMLCLHGAGERGTDNELHIKFHGMATSWADPSAQSKHPCFVVAPQCPENNQWVDTDWTEGTYSIDDVPESNELQAVMNLLDKLINEFNIDRNRIYITGLSMGGYGTWDAIARHPERFAAAVPMSGAGDTSKVDRIKNIPVWDFHGAKDNIVPVSGSRDMLDAMNKLGLQVIETKGMSESDLDYHLNNGAKHLYTEYPQGYHAVWQESYDMPGLHEWVFSQSKNPTGFINHKTGSVEKSFQLKQNYPNPFNPSTMISFYLPKGSFITLSVFNSLGQLVANLESNYLVAGNYSYTWQAFNHSSGPYYYRLSSGKFEQTHKMLLVH